jgi:uncharacterized RDD family membrane protein YckC
VSGGGGWDQRIVTGEAVALELRPAGLASRGLALVVDLTVQLAVLLVAVLVLERTGARLESAAAQAAFLVGFVALVLGYPVGFETLWHGRTPGKAALGLRAVRDDGGPIRLRHAFVRGLVGVVLDRPGFTLALLALVPMLLTARSKRLGDLAAGTFVVQERMPAGVAAPAAMPPALEGWARALDLTGVDDSLALEARQLLARADQLAPWAREEMGARLVAAVAARVGPPPPGAPGWAFLAAVLAERRRRALERAAGHHSSVAPAPPPPPAGPPAGPQPGRQPGPYAPPG